jgi:hypothetical protein
MRTFTIVLICLFLSLPSTGQDAKPYKEMTYQELQAIDASALSKAEKKLYKKALSAAKKAEKARAKAEKKRIAAEKKAAKSRARAEAKRLKAQEKARFKHNKNIYKHIELIDKTYAKSTIIKDDFKAFVEIVGPRHPKGSPFFNYRENVDYRLRAFYYPNEPQLLFRLQLSKKIVVSELNSESIKTLRGTPERFATREGYWGNYEQAALRGGIDLEVVPLARYLSNCTAVECYFREDIGVTLKITDFITPLENIQNLELKVFGNTGPSYLASIPAAYIIGFLKKVGELDGIAGELAVVASESEKLIRSLLQTATR